MSELVIDPRRLILVIYAPNGLNNNFKDIKIKLRQNRTLGRQTEIVCRGKKYSLAWEDCTSLQRENLKSISGYINIKNYPCALRQACHAQHKGIAE